MAKYFAEIEFEDKAKNLYWFPFYLTAIDDRAAHAFLKRHVVELKKRFSIKNKKLYPVRGTMASKQIQKYRAKAWSGTPVHIEISTFVLTKNKQLLATYPQLDFHQNETWLVNRLGNLQREFLRKNKFPVQVTTAPKTQPMKLIAINILKN